MATKTMLKTVNIRDKRLGKNLVEAIENAMAHKNKKPVSNVTCEEVTKEKLKDIFG